MESKFSASTKLVRMKMKNSLTLILLATLFTSCEDFLSGPLLDQNPNEVDDVSIVSPEA